MAENAKFVVNSWAVYQCKGIIKCRFEVWT